MAKNDNLTDFLTGIADAIRSRKSSTDKISPQSFASEIASIGINGHTVTFIDVDGTILKTEAVADGGSATPPDNPTREYCTFVKWAGNYTNVKADTIVGALYKSSDGKTRYKIKVAPGGGFQFDAPSSSVTINWGDSNEETIEAGSTAAHTYTSGFEGWISASGAISVNSDYRKHVVEAIAIEIGASAFENCYALESVVISDGVTVVGDKAFGICSSLRSVILPDGIVTIGEGAFAKCYALQSVVIPESVTSIGDSAFSSCFSLKSIVIPNGVTQIAGFLFYYCYSLRSIVVPGGVTSIGQSAFEHCTALESVVIPNGVTSIGSNAFANCSTLRSMVIPDEIVSIGEGAFFRCYALQSAVIPESVTSIGSNAFNKCYALRLVRCLATTPPTVEKSTYSTFENIYIATFYVPDDSVEAYKAATGWSDYSDRILPISQYTE